MTGGLLLLVVGVVLVFAAVLAREAPLRAIGLGRVGRTPRIAVAGGGVLCVVAALILIAGDNSDRPAGPVRVTITTELGPEQISEETRVFIDGHYIGMLKIDESSPEARLTETVQAGRRDYKTESKVQLKGEDEPQVAINEGQVIIDGKTPLTIFYNEKAPHRTYLKPPE
jgi:hypothetical protein